MRPALLVLRVAVVVLVAAACGASNPEPSPSSVSSRAPEPSRSATPGSTAVPSPTAVTIAPDRPLAASGSIAVVREDGTLWLVDIDGRATSLTGAQDGSFGFPAWSPDGSRIAAIRSSATEAAIVIIDVERATTGLLLPPAVIFRSGSIGPFYLSWTPDGKEVSFLANELGDLSLRIAPADGSAPVDGSGPGAVIRMGSPLYYDWIGPDLLIAHIGTGTDAFLGEVGRNDSPVAKTIDAPGPFRSADVSGDGRYVSFVRAGTGGEVAVVVAARDGSSEHSMAVFDMAAVDFGPTDDLVASIGAIEPVATSLGIPVGPLRLLDAATGEVRTLLDSPVVSFAWSPDGSTIAAIEIVMPADGTETSSASPASSPASSAAPAGRTEIRLAFVDVATGKIRSQPVVAPGPTYVNALMAYFDQYALSHRLWAPDSSSILLPQIDQDGTTHVDVFFPDGDPPISLEGEMGFWSP